MAADIAAWWDAHGTEDEPDGVLRATYEAHPALRRPLLAAALAAEAVVAVPARFMVPTPARVPRRARAAVSLLSWDQVGDLDQLAANAELIDALLGSVKQLREFSTRTVILSPEKIRRIYEMQSPSALRVGLWRLLHVPKVLARYGLGLLGLIWRHPLHSSVPKPKTAGGAIAP